MLQLSRAVRQARAAETVRAFGLSPVLELRSGDVPAECSDPDSGLLVAVGTLPALWAEASDGRIEKRGRWLLTARARGTVGHFRVRTQGGAVLAQGEAALLGIGAVEVEEGQAIEVERFNLTEGNE